MLIDLKKIDEPIYIDKDLQIDLNNYHSKDIYGLKDIHLQGTIKVSSTNYLVLNLILKGTMVLKDSITLDLIDKEFTAKIDEEYALNDEYLKENVKNKQNVLDIVPILWENIVLEVPISYTKAKNVSLSGDGWQFAEEKPETGDPRLAKLSQLLDGEE